MYINTALVIFIMAVTLGILLGITNFVNNNIIYNNNDQAFATHMETATSNEKTCTSGNNCFGSKSSD